ncbi:hypothetical protein [Streptomyces prasinopilosus]|uniref:hypothetical protein n=1 Tax=Streptomyces prasinopilosus TaxID=67344 RepID=UPI0006EB83D4|nr:hypothetical protein [Streptomyces prasinopilosus]
MDLHAWITRQVDRVEASARAELEYRRVVFEPHSGGPAITGTVTGVTQTPDGLQLDIAQCGVEPRDETPAPVQSATAVLRRCEADRRILARHRLATEWTWAHEAPCHGCGTEGDCDDPVTENLNDCPELLDLAHAHGLTDEILAGLDRPQPPEADGGLPDDFGYEMRITSYPTRPITTADVPAALRGPHWKP